MKLLVPLKIPEIESGVNKDKQALSDAYDVLNEKIKQSGLLTISELPTNIAALIKDGTIDVNNKILDADLKAKLEKMRGVINGTTN